MPLIISGVRIAVSQVIATATLGAFVGYNTLGRFITVGRANGDDGMLYGGVVLVVGLALIAEVGFRVLQRSLTPWARVVARVDGLDGPSAAHGNRRRARRFLTRLLGIRAGARRAPAEEGALHVPSSRRRVARARHPVALAAVACGDDDTRPRRFLGSKPDGQDRHAGLR